MEDRGLPRPKVPTKPELWESILEQARATSLGSAPGRWSEQKSLAARVAYRQQGGRFRYVTAQDFTEAEIEEATKQMMEAFGMDREQAEVAAIIALTGVGDTIDLAEEDDGE